MFLWNVQMTKENGYLTFMKYILITNYLISIIK